MNLDLWAVAQAGKCLRQSAQKLSSIARTVYGKWVGKAISTLIKDREPAHRKQGEVILGEAKNPGVSAPVMGRPSFFGQKSSGDLLA
jgi:hypothetical protein